MSKLLSFVAGAAEGFSEMIDKSEKSAKEEAALRVRRLMDNHKEVMESNLKLENELKAEEGWIKTYFSNATPEQVAYLQSNPAALQALKKMPDPTKVGELGNVIKIAAANEAASVTQDQLTALPAVANEVAARVKEKARSTGFFRGLADEAGERVGITTERSLARGLGTTVEQMESIKRTARPSVEGAFDVAKTLEKTPESVEDMVKTANVARVQAKQKFGEGSAEYKAANETFTSLSNEIEKTDKGLDARANRLNIAVLDEQDPVKKKALQSELNSTQQAIKDHKEATSTRAEKAAGSAPAAKATLNSVQKSVAMFVDSRMRQDKGFDWAKHVDFKEIPLPDGGVYVSTTVKATLPPEKQREVFEKIRMLEADALKTNGYVVAGAPRNDAVKEFINNKNIPAEYYSGRAPVAPAAAQPTQPVAPAVVATPAAAPVRSFRTVADAEAARLPKGTKITIGGRPAEVQ
jgi:hypothetical protein